MCWGDGVGRWERLQRRLRVSLETRGSTVRFPFCFYFILFCCRVSKMGAHGMVLVVTFDLPDMGV